MGRQSCQDSAIHRKRLRINREKTRHIGGRLSSLRISSSTRLNNNTIRHIWRTARWQNASIQLCCVFRSNTCLIQWSYHNCGCKYWYSSCHTRQEAHKHQAPVAPRIPDLSYWDAFSHHAESSALPTELRDGQLNILSINQTQQTTSIILFSFKTVEQ